MDRSWEYINRSQTHEIGTDAAQLPEKEYINGIFSVVQGVDGVTTKDPAWGVIFFGLYYMVMIEMLC